MIFIVQLELINIYSIYKASEYLNSIHVTKPFYIYPSNVYKIKYILSVIKNKKSSGWDNISIKVFLHLPYISLEVLAKVNNECFRKGVVCTNLKLASVLPLYKRRLQLLLTFARFLFY